MSGSRRYPLLAVSGHSIDVSECPLRGKSGHRLDLSQCPLMTQSEHCPKFGGWLAPRGCFSTKWKGLAQSSQADLITAVSYAEPSRAGRPDAPARDEDLQKASQNPIADLVSVPFQSNTNFNAGPFNRTQEVLNIQPVVPMHLNENWNVISRTIIPWISQPDPLLNSNTNGVGDITQSLFLSPVRSRERGRP